MEVKEIKEDQILNNFVGSQKQSQFLQSWQWGEFQKNINNKIKRFALYDNQELVGIALAIKNNLPFGTSYWYIPRGPIVSDQLHPDKFLEVFEYFIGELVAQLSETKVMFIKIEPPLEKHHLDKFTKAISKYKFVAEKFVQPQDSWLLDFNMSEEDLLAQMHHKTRYNIRLAEKKGVIVRIGSTEEDFEKFWQLNKVTADRDRFRSHNREYYYNIFKTLSPSGIVKIYLAEFENKTLAANLVYFFGDTVTYVHGSSSNEYRNLMAPHLLQWQQIKDAKESNYKYYDFGGIAPDGSAKEMAWSGITRFKKGFGGHGVSYLGVYDLILNNFWYKLYKIVKKIKK
ncbi:MAG: lipid II:glycine glycyltransferase FemX [Candidatus Kerfeldbacteria bacterium]|jgi:lipid II:glycine glycyltransferase (peptidoglycan interpeptide bridge formation enzyme)